MLPLDPFVLFLLKFFVVITCVVFWVRLGVRALMRYYRQATHHHPHRERRHRH